MSLRMTSNWLSSLTLPAKESCTNSSRRRLLQEKRKDPKSTRTERVPNTVRYEEIRRVCMVRFYTAISRECTILPSPCRTNRKKFTVVGDLSEMQRHALHGRSTMLKCFSVRNFKNFYGYNSQTLRWIASLLELCNDETQRLGELYVS